MTTTRTLVTAWDRTVLLDGERLLRTRSAPATAEAVASRLALRREGRLTPEEEELLAERGAETWRTRDRRLVGPGVVYDPTAPGVVPGGASPGSLRNALLADAERALTAAWDPSIHLEEAVRAARELDRASNQVGERLASWASKDTPGLDPSQAALAAAAVLRGSEPHPLGPRDPAVLAARRRLAEAYRTIVAVRDELQAAVSAATPGRTPNLSALLGPELAAQMLAQAGSLDRLARLPASTIQVLGAERAFFEHLRGRAPPPRHGLLFLHPSIRSASRSDRGRLARTLAAKVAIAARIDRAGGPVDPELRRAYEARREALRTRRAPGSRRRSRPGLATPLDRAARHRHLGR
jgi:nucleolar protein 56